jgi:hypothetical protein
MLKTLEERLLNEAQKLRDQERLLPDGPLREWIHVRQADLQAHLEKWFTSKS